MAPNLPIFVYGTLLPGQPNAYLWGDSVVAVASAEIPNAILFDMGYYPMLIEGQGRVRGVLMHVSDAHYEAVVTRLDALESYDPADPDASEYVRAARQVDTAEGSVQAWVYIGQARLVKGRFQVDDGDWLAYAAPHEESLSAWWQAIQNAGGQRPWPTDDEPPSAGNR